MTAAVLLTLLLANGCCSLISRTWGTDAKFFGSPYEGTKNEAAICVVGLLTGPGVIVPLLDWPLTAALDTLLLPFDLFHEEKIERKPVERATPATVAFTPREDDSHDAIVEGKEVAEPPKLELQSGEAK
jgi:uncharacterized protein YceK